MRRIHKITFLFFGMLAFIWMVFWYTLQSEQFGSYFSEKISFVIKKKFNIEASFREIEVKMIPPGLVLKNVHVISKKSYEVYFSRLDVSFGIFDIIFNKITLDRILCDDGIIFYRGNKKNEKLNLDFLFQKIPQNYRRTHLKSVWLKNVYFQYDDKNVFLKRIEARLTRNTWRLNGSIENIQTPRGVIDSLDVDIWPTTGSLQSSLRFRKGSSIVALNGEINKKGEIEGNFSANFNYREILPFLDNKIYKISSGFFELEGSLTGVWNNPNWLLRGEARKLITRYADLDKAIFKVQKNSTSINLLSFYGEKDNDDFKVLKKATLWKDNKIIPNGLVLKLNGNVKNSLYIVRDIFKNVKARLNGSVGLEYENEKLAIKTLPQFQIKNLELLMQNNDLLLGLKRINLKSSVFKYDLDKEELTFSATPEWQKHNCEITGIINNKSISIDSTPMTINLEKMGPLGGVKLRGIGKTKIKVTGNSKRLKYEFDSDFKDYSMLGYYLGRVKGPVIYDDQENTLSFEKIAGESRENIYTLSGGLDFSKKTELKIDLLVKDALYDDLTQMLFPLFRLTSTLPKKMASRVRGRMLVSGPLDDLEAEGQVVLEKSEYLGERIPFSRFFYSYKNKEHKLKDIFIEMNSGKITGDILIDSKNLKYKFSGKDVKFDEFNHYKETRLGMKGLVEGEIEGVWGKELDAKLKFKDIRLGKLRLLPSYFTISNLKGVWTWKTNLSNKLIYIEGQIDTRKGEGPSYLRGEVTSREIATLLGIFSLHNIYEKGIKGALIGRWDFKFPGTNVHKTSGSLKVDDFYLTRKNKNLILSQGRNLGEIKEGKINNWALEARGSLGTIVSEATGALNQFFTIKNHFRLDASLMELLSPIILKSNGNIEGKMTISGTDKDYKVAINGSSRNLLFRPSFLPGTFDDCKVVYSLIKYTLNVDELNCRYLTGNIKGSGEMIFAFPYPHLNLTSFFERIRWTKEKTTLISEGKIKITGKGPPYEVVGDVGVTEGGIYDEIEDFMKGRKIQVHHTYLPKGEKGGFYNLKLNVDFLGPFIVKNSLVDLKFDGNLFLGRTFYLPLMKGSMVLLEGGKFFFKNHEFILSKGDMTFGTEDNVVNPELNFTGVSRIGDYDVNLYLYGKGRNFNVEFSSDPPLSREDIYSLLTVGLVGDVSKSLNDAERQNLTSVGIGSIIFNRFKIAQGLKSNFGLNLSVGPELTEDEGNLLEAEAGTNTLGLMGRFKSATKVKLQKKLNNNVNLSVSSTLGGNIGSKQEMNVDYNLKKNMTLKGIYEVKTDTGESVNSNSLGADINFHWNFD